MSTSKHAPDLEVVELDSAAGDDAPEEKSKPRQRGAAACTTCR